jgi:hypothetical protein
MNLQSIEQRFRDAAEFRAYVELTEANHDLWRVGARRARVDEAHVARVTAAGGRWHLLALSEDWCGDAFNSLPVVARLAELAPNVELRLLGRDANLDLMDAHLSGTARAIPVVIVYDEDWNEVGWWGSRPASLQALVKGDWAALDKAERYRKVREWYARDGGATTVEEIVMIIEAAAGVARERQAA